MSADKYTVANILNVHHWTSHLMSIRVARPLSFKFTAGQFARVGVANAGGQFIFRALSLVSSPFDDYVEFFISIVPQGEFSALIAEVAVGASLAIEKLPFGYLTLSRFQTPLPKHLWLLATGTGAAPFFSMLQQFDIWQHYTRIIFAYSVRHESELAYQHELTTWAAQYGDASKLCVIPVITRQVGAAKLTQRLPVLIASGALENEANVKLDASAHVLLCGNPAMIEDTRHALMAKGLTMNRRGVGNVAVENYW